MSANDVTLRVAGQDFGGWKSVRIEAGIERQARSFDLEVTDKWPGNTEVTTRIKPGDDCEVRIGDDLVLTGYVDATPIQYDGKTYSVAVRGRSKTADLVDCCPPDSASAVTGGDTWKHLGVLGPGESAKVVKPATSKPSNQWRGKKLEQIAAELAAPYGIRVIAETDTGAAIADHQLQQGETVFESIDRLMRLRHVLSTDNANGDLVFIEVGGAGRAGTALELGKNVLAASCGLDYAQVFTEYVCKGQRAGDDDESGVAVAEIQSSVVDKILGRRRVLILRQSGQVDEGTAGDRVEYERAHRAAKAIETEYVVQGWRQEDGALWVPNQLVRVRDPLIGFDTDLLIAEITYKIDERGTVAALKVGPEDGYITKAAKAAKKGKGGGSWLGDVK